MRQITDVLTAAGPCQKWRGFLSVLHGRRNSGTSVFPATPRAKAPSTLHLQWRDYGTVRSLPTGASGFTTIELKSNLIGTARDGLVICTARPAHKGRTTQVWDAEVRRAGDDAVIACFRNTQLILWPKT